VTEGRPPLDGPAPPQPWSLVHSATGPPTPPPFLHAAARRFPPPWSVDEQNVCFIVRDNTGQALAYVYFEEEPGRRSAAKLLTATRPAASRRTSLKLPKLLLRL
jgi:hypothetical protein